MVWGHGVMIAGALICKRGANDIICKWGANLQKGRAPFVTSGPPASDVSPNLQRRAPRRRVVARTETSGHVSGTVLPLVPCVSARSSASGAAESGNGGVRTSWHVKGTAEGCDHREPPSLDSRTHASPSSDVGGNAHDTTPIVSLARPKLAFTKVPAMRTARSGHQSRRVP